MQRIECDVLICGDSLGGCAASLQLGRRGLRTVMLKEFPWPGGQMTSQAVPPDEHPWIEEFGRTSLYAQYRQRVRQACRSLGMNPEAAADPRLNPGGGWVSRLCHEPALGARVLEQMMAEAGRPSFVPGPAERVEVSNDRITAVEAGEWRIEPRFVLDATETGEILALSGAEHVVGAESRADTGEPHALEGPADRSCQQPVTWCAVFGWDPQGSHSIDRPAGYEKWRAWVPPSWPGPLFSFEYPNVRTGETTRFPLFSDDWWNLFSYRQIVDPAKWPEARCAATVVNWPQNDMMAGSVLLGREEKDRTLADARELTFSVLYWLQSEMGYEGLFLAPDLAGSADGLAQAPYIRESRRALTTGRLTELEVGAECNPGLERARPLSDAVAVGAYRIDLHPRINGMTTIDISSLPFQIPLGSLVPVRLQNLIPACKNIGVTHVANGCTRLHPVEWGIGEAAGVLAAWCLRQGLAVQAVAESPMETLSLQSEMVHSGLELEWPCGAPLRPL